MQHHGFPDEDRDYEAGVRPCDEGTGAVQAGRREVRREGRQVQALAEVDGGESGGLRVVSATGLGPLLEAGSPRFVAGLHHLIEGAGLSLPVILQALLEGLPLSFGEHRMKIAQQYI